MEQYGLDSPVLEERPLAWFCEHGNEPSVSVKDGEYLEEPRDCWFPKKDSAPYS
jgi:hypothetical protein